MISVVQLLVQKSGPKYKKSNSGVAWNGRGKAPEWIESKNLRDGLQKSAP